MDIASELARTRNIDGLHWYMLMGVASIGYILKSLRFVTRPSFALVGNSFTGYQAAARHGLGLSNRSFSADEARYCFVEVAGRCSLADLGVGGDAFWENLEGRWKKLEKSNTHTVIQTPLEGCLGIPLELEFKMVLITVALRLCTVQKRKGQQPMLKRLLVPYSRSSLDRGCCTSE